MSWAWLRWLASRIFTAPVPGGFEESLLDLGPSRLGALRASLKPGETLLGGLAGWKRVRGGPRASVLGVTSGRVLIVEQRLFRKPTLSEMTNSELRSARCRNLGLFCRLDLLTRQNEAITLTVPKTATAFATLAVGKIREMAGLPTEVSEGVGDSYLHRLKAKGWAVVSRR